MGILRFLPTLNNPLIGAAARRGAAGKPKIASGFERFRLKAPGNGTFTDA
jgi:hypothetical protein